MKGVCVEAWQPGCNCCTSSNSPPSCREQVLKLAQTVDCDFPSCQVWMDSVCPSQAVSLDHMIQGRRMSDHVFTVCVALCRCMVQAVGVWLLCGCKGGVSGMVCVPYPGSCGMSRLCLLWRLLPLLPSCARVQSCDVSLLRMWQA